MKILKWILGKNKNEGTATSNRNHEDELNSLEQLCDDDRMRKIIEWCDKGDNSKLPTIQHAILYDSDIGVKSAAFKRIHLFSDKDNVRKFLKEKNTKEVGQKCEPYYSMALSRTGLITIEEFKKRIG